MDHEQRENFTFIIFKSIIVFISLCIAGFLIALFCMVSKVEADQIYTLPVSHLYGIRRSGNNCYGTYNDIILNCSGDLKGLYAEHWTSNTVMQPNHTYYFEITAIVTTPTLTGTPVVYHSIEYENNGWHTATSDRNERVTLAPYNDGVATIVTWTFEIDSTIWTTSLNIGLGVNNAYFYRITEYNAKILDLTGSTPGDTDQIIASNEKQTSEINQQSKENTSSINSNIQEQGQAITGKLNDINNTLNNDSVSAGRGSAIVNGISSNAGSGLAGIINTPLGVISGLLQQNTCSDIVAPLPFVNKNLTLPCLTPIYEDKFGSFFDIYQVIITGIVAYWVTMNIFLKTKKMSMPDDDRIEVLDL